MPLDRLTSWKDGTGVQNQLYNDNGSIASNKVGAYAYTINQKPYQVSTITPVVPSATYDYYANRMQNITYNVSNNPVSIKELNAENIDFEYNAFDNRSTMYYGGLEPLKADRPYRKYYSADGTMEIKRNVTNNTVEFVTYIGGDAYTAPVVLKSDGATKEFLYLHRDYQGTIVGISNSTGALVEKRWFDVWGSLIRYANSSGVTTIPTVSTGLLLDRGYTGHEHLLGVNIINMNGRIYDDKLHRFLQPDDNVQDPYNTQNFNRYGYVMNNPTKYTDPSGEFWQYLVGALFSSYASGVQSSGGQLSPFKWDSNAWTNAGLGAASYAASKGATYYSENYIYGNQNSNTGVENLSSTNNIENQDYVHQNADIHAPYRREFNYKPLTSAESDAFSILNFGGGVFFDEFANYIGSNAKKWSKMGRFDPLNQIDFLNAIPDKKMGDVFDTDYLKSLKGYSKLVGTYGGHFANGLGYVGAADKFMQGDNVGGAIDAVSNSISIGIGNINPYYGAAWSFGWWLGEKLSHTELYNRVLFGKDSAIYQERSIYWFESKFLKD